MRKRDNEKGVLGLPARTARERPSLGAYASSGVPGSSACVTLQVKLRDGESAGRVKPSARSGVSRKNRGTSLMRNCPLPPGPP